MGLAVAIERINVIVLVAYVAILLCSPQRMTASSFPGTQCNSVSLLVTGQSISTPEGPAIIPTAAYTSYLPRRT